jgi:hypothetical protein
VSHFLPGLPSWLLIALIVIVPTDLTMIAQVLIRRLVGIETLVKNNEIAGFKFATVGDTADMSEVFRQIDQVTAARRVRLHLATGLVPDVIWIALFAGALLNVGFTLFFGSENLLAQVSMTGVLSLLVTLGLVVIISHADALATVLEEFGKPPG